MRRLVCALTMAVVSAGFARAESQPATLRPIAVVLDDPSPSTHALAAAGIASLGGRVVHAFDDLLIVTFPTGRELRAYRIRGVREVLLNAVPASPRHLLAPSAGIAAWNGIAMRMADTDRPGAAAEPLNGDALTPPTISVESVRAASDAAAVRLGTKRAPAPQASIASTGAPYGATILNTSEFLAGSVSVNLILVESDGTNEFSSENWSATREAEVVSKVAAGLEWDRLQEPQAALRFVYHVYAGRTDPRARTGYEPIRHPADPNGLRGEDLWVRDVLAKFGYASGDRFARSRAMASDTRAADGTDWAVNVFVVDSLADSDGKFADGRFAYTWIGGPHLVMTYDNQTWGVDRMDMVVRHELLHAFYAFDEYAVSFCNCTDHRGYLDGANTNCVNCNATAGACVMIANGDALCGATRRQLGWADLDGDGVIDVVGEDPDTFLDAAPSPVCTTPTLSGLASVTAATNRNTFTATPLTSISVNRIAGVEVRADGAAWTSASPDAGTWGLPQERFLAAFPTLGPGAHVLEARAVDDRGNTDQNPGRADVLVQSGLSALGDSVRVGKGGANAVTMTWGACGGATKYRLYRRATANGLESVVAETAATSWTVTPPGTGYYQVRPVDACGGERAD